MAARPSTSRLSRSARYLAWTASGSKGAEAEPGRDMGKGYPTEANPDARVRFGRGRTRLDTRDCSAPLDRAGAGVYSPPGHGHEEEATPGHRVRGHDAFLEWLKGVPDPQERYRRATDELEGTRRRSSSSPRCGPLPQPTRTTPPVRRGLAGELGVSPTRAHQLIKEAKERPSKGEPTKRRSSDRQKEGA